LDNRNFQESESDEGFRLHSSAFKQPLQIAKSMQGRRVLVYRKDLMHAGVHMRSSRLRWDAAYWRLAERLKKHYEIGFVLKLCK